jgi:hypothetical protein
MVGDSGTTRYGLRSDQRRNSLARGDPPQRWAEVWSLRTLLTRSGRLKTKPRRLEREGTTAERERERLGREDARADRLRAVPDGSKPTSTVNQPKPNEAPTITDSRLSRAYQSSGVRCQERLVRQADA